MPEEHLAMPPFTERVGDASSAVVARPRFFGNLSLLTGTTSACGQVKGDAPVLFMEQCFCFSNFRLNLRLVSLFFPVPTRAQAGAPNALCPVLRAPRPPPPRRPPPPPPPPPPAPAGTPWPLPSRRAVSASAQAGTSDNKSTRTPPMETMGCTPALAGLRAIITTHELYECCVLLAPHRSRLRRKAMGIGPVMTQQGGALRQTLAPRPVRRSLRVMSIRVSCLYECCTIPY
jgi:hypothetical protein